jgi:plastocyanin
MSIGSRRLSSGYLTLAFLLLTFFMLIVAIPVTNVEAQGANSPQNYTIYAGYSGQGSIRLLSFLPIHLQVHRGDTVTWYFGGGLHNVRFPAEDEVNWLPVIIPMEIEGESKLIGNPAVIYRSEGNEGVFTGEPINSGVQIGPNGVIFGPDAMYAYTLSIDAEPGSYFYLCDIHPGMAATLEVVDNDVEIPSPGEVADAVAAQVASAIYQATQLMFEMEEQYPSMTDSDTLEVIAGVEQMIDGIHVSIDRYFPSTAVIKAGQSVSWVIGEQNIVSHSVTYPYRGWEEQNLYYMDAEGNPVLEITGVLALPTLENGGEWMVNAEYNHSGIIFPGTPFTIR